MFPHMAIMCFSARKVTAFKRTVVLYPLAIMLIWLPCVFLGVLGAATLGKVAEADGILLLMLEKYAPVWLAGILGAGIISAVMGSDAHQVLAVSTMFTKDILPALRRPGEIRRERQRPFRARVHHRRDAGRLRHRARTQSQARHLRNRRALRLLRLRRAWRR